MDQSRIRNFCIIAHIDHGKSTLADRLLELTGTLQPRQMRNQVLDKMELEREKGITIKLQPVRMQWQNYLLNLIDTPGHVDFSYEVSRSLAACEGALLLVDAAQGIQAQTLANIYLAVGAGLTIIPVVNKIDLPAAEPDRVSADLAGLLGCQQQEVLRISAKTGEGVEQILTAISQNIPAPAGKTDQPLQALVFDSTYDEHRGVILDIRVVNGQLNKGDAIKLMASATDSEVMEVGVFSPEPQPVKQLAAGEIGYIVTNFKSVGEARVGDTVTLAKQSAQRPLPGYQQVKPYVYAGFFPASSEQHQQLKEALAKLQLNDAAMQYSAENSQVLGFGFRIGFLGLLHMEIIKERLQREYKLELVITNPSTAYEVKLNNGDVSQIQSASELPDVSSISEVREPWIKGEVVTPKSYVGAVIQLVTDSRGRQTNLKYLDDKTALVDFEAPLANVLTDFYDRLKSISSGYASLSYEPAGFRTEDLVRLDILVGGEMVDALSQIVHRSEATIRGRHLVEKLKDVIPRQLFEVPIQAAIGGKIIAREDIKALGKNVTGHLYGGDVTRKRKLWEKQKAGKMRMKKFGKVEIPPEAFAVLLKRD